MLALVAVQLKMQPELQQIFKTEKDNLLGLAAMKHMAAVLDQLTQVIKTSIQSLQQDFQHTLVDLAV
jgi:hypothetical protein|tara:strand:+ start:826 stop:1026 length:201 start_codon:yes stop_codon:yes gene_type:complete